jgi:predicted amidohydrolase YtcJ
MKVLYNARIRTFDEKNPCVTALAIENGRILAIGDDDTILSMAPLACQKQDLEGMYIQPGFSDAHIHLLQYAQSREKIDCETQTKAQCLSKILEKVHQTRPGQWILGHGWNHNLWGGQYGDKEELDTCSRLNPIYLSAKSLHAAWVNSKALQIAGIDANTPDPAGGLFEKDRNGELTGIIFDNAIPLVEKAIPKPSPIESMQLLARYQRDLLGFGITCSHDFDDLICFSALQILHQQNDLKFRVIKGIPFLNLDEIISLGLHTGSGDDFLRIGSVKLFADGALGPKTAAMFEPYENDPVNKGLIIKEVEDLAEIGSKATRAGISVAIHAIGDRGNEVALQAFAKIREFEKRKKLPLLPHRIEHAQLIRPDQLTRFHELKLIASMQPLHATSDQDMALENWGKRACYSYAWRLFHDNHIPLIFGSDAPVESPNPFLGLYAAVTRKKHDRFSLPFFPELTLTVDQALAAYITNPPQVLGTQAKMGRISPQFLADLVVFHSDFLKMDVESLYNVKPVMTMVNGEWVWQG